MSLRAIWRLSAFVLLLAAVAVAQRSLPSFAEPALSPDGSELAFVSGGDIWTVPATGGDAHLLVAHPATESRPLYSPDGRYLAFVSTRTGNGDIYLLELATGTVRRLTFDDGYEQLDAWSPDSRFVYFSSTARDIAGMNDVFRVSIDGGTPMAVTSERYVNEFGAAPSPDGATLLFTARGMASSQWWRNGHSHIDQTELWTLRDGRYERLMPRGAKQLWPMWSPDGRTVYFMSDRSGSENLWSLGPDKQPRQLTHFTSGRVLWPSIARDGRSIVFERNFGIWSLDLATGKAAEVPIRLRGTPVGSVTDHRKISEGIRDLALSPDGRKIVFTVRGDIFATSAKDGGDAIRVTNTPARESQLTWAPDNRQIAYVSNRDGHDHIFLYDFTRERETQLTTGASDNDTPQFSPDGKLLAFQRDRRQLVALDLATKKETVAATGLLDRPPLGSQRPFDWSPDSRWLVFTSYGDKMFRNASVVPVKGGEARQVSFLSNVFTETVSWSPDGKYLLMSTSQRTEPGEIARIDLVPRILPFREDQFRDLFKDDKQPAPEKSKAQEPAPETKPVDKPDAPKPEAAKGEDRKGPKARPTEVVFDGIRQRSRYLSLGLDVDFDLISPDGKWLAIVATAAVQQNIYVYSLEELPKEPPVARQVTATAGRKAAVQFTPDSKELYYLENGRINLVALDSAKPRPLAVSAELDVDFQREKTEAFEEAWRLLRDTFFDPKMNGLDWKKVHDDFAPHVAGAATRDEMRRVISLMLGELNASHMGISAPSEDRRTATGRLGLRFDSAEYAASGKLRVSEVIALSPAALAGIKEGDYLLAVDGVDLTPHTALESLLEFKIGRKTILSVSSASSASSALNPRSVSLKPVDLSAEKHLLYRSWVQKNRDYVERISGGRLGYAHMIDMSDGSLRQLFADLDTDNHRRDGVIIDIRNNNGGFVNAYALDVLARRHYLNMSVRGFPPSPARTMLGQRALELPTILITNQHSLSDAEDFTEGFRALGLGRIIGEPTAGWIIYTSGAQLVDGSTLRLPFTRITTADGEDMEMHPRPVDIEVQRPLGETARAVDSQLDTAIRELTAQLDTQKKLDAEKKKAKPGAVGK